MSHLKQKPSFIMLIVLILDFSFIFVPPIHQGNAQPPVVPVVSVDPPMIDDPTKVSGDTFTININIANAENLYGWQVNMTFNPTVLNTSNAQIVFGDFLSQFYQAVEVKYVNNAAGSLLVSSSFATPYPSDGAYGDGWLASITFKVKASGSATLLQFVLGTKLRTVSGDTLIDIENFKTSDGGFDNRAIGVNALPVASFSIQSLAADKRGVVDFDASASYDPDTWLMSYLWDYGDGSSNLYIRGENLTALTSHNYTQNGVYPVTLTVKDYDNATATDSKTATVRFDIAVTAVTSPQIMVISGTPVQVDVTAVNNGDFLETFNVSAYANQELIGKQTVANLAPDTQTILHFTWDTTGASLGGYVLKANATVVLGEVNTTNNEYVDGLVTVAETNIFNYPVIVGGKTFIVQVNSTSSLGNLSFISSQKKISLQVSGETGTSAFCNITILMALLNVSMPSAWIVNFDGNPWPSTINQNGTHYFIFLEYTHTTHTVEIIGETVATPPIAQFTPSKTTAFSNESISFDASASTDSDGTIISWTWNFDDGEISSGEVVQHSFVSFGVYDVMLTVKDNDDLSNSTTITITIIDYPVANFTYAPKPPIAGQAVTFDASASQPKGGSITSYSWTFGDGETNTSAIVIHEYATTGTFTVNLTVIDSEGLNDSVSAVLLVIGYPEANFTFTPHEPYINQAVTFDASASQPNGGTLESYLWKFGDGQNSTGASTTHSYTQEGTYTIQLTVTDTEDLTNTVSAEITVKLLEESNLSISAAPTILTLGQTTTITGKLSPTLNGETITLRYKLETASTWNFLGNQTTDTNGQYAFSWKPTSTGTYQIEARWGGNSETQACESQAELITVYQTEQQPILQEPDATPYALAAIAIILLMTVTVYFLKIRK